MNKQRVTVILLILTVLLIIGCVVERASSDRQAPEIKFREDGKIVYDGADQSSLLEQVSAVDKEDGQVEVMIEKIIPLTDGRYKVYYVARDKSGNVAKAFSIAEGTESVDAPVSSQTEPSEPEEPTEEIPSEPETAAPEETDPVNPGAPVIVLTTHEVTIARGGDFRYARYVDSITDDKDDSDVLYRRLQVTGEYSNTVSGSYEINYYVTDTDGNKSNVETLTLIVE